MWRLILPPLLRFTYRQSSTGWTWGSSGGHARPRHVPSLIFAIATVATFRPLVTTASILQQNNNNNDDVETNQQQYDDATFPFTTSCPSYGCPFFPQDVVYNETLREALTKLREGPSNNSTTTLNTTVLSWNESAVLATCGNQDRATLTLIGYKGGDLQDQINQDRAIIVDPFIVGKEPARLLGVFDGHAALGELVSEFTANELPKRLSEKLRDNNNNIDKTKQVLIDTFVEMDKMAPASISGGCTASVVLQMGDKIYVANAGDSRSFVAIYRRGTKKTRVVYKSREDKPHLPDERKRVESMGGTVYVPSATGTTSRVMYLDPRTGRYNGLAMSRSIGDWEYGKLGVIPNPIVDVLDIPELVQAELRRSNKRRMTMSQAPECFAVDQDGTAMPDAENTCQARLLDQQNQQDDDVYIFAVSATDGMMDFASAEMIASLIASSFFEKVGPHPLTACEQLISAAATGWYKAKKGRYRDDIAIAVAKLRVPPADAEDEEETSS